MGVGRGLFSDVLLMSAGAQGIDVSQVTPQTSTGRRLPCRNNEGAP
jgi:hypothetical protein